MMARKRSLLRAVEARLALLGDPVDGEPADRQALRRELTDKAAAIRAELTEPTRDPYRDHE